MVKFIPKYTILFDAIVNITAFLISFFTAMYRTTIDFCISIFYSVLFSLFSLTFPKYNPPGELLFQVTSIKSPRTNIPQDTFGKHKPNLYNYFVLSPVTHAAAIYAFRPLFILYPLHAASSPLVCLENSCVYF